MAHSDQGIALTPSGIRALRGAKSRAAFASKVGVTAQTVYRWELSPDRAESRRPRGAERARLEALVGSASAAESSARPAALPVASSSLTDDDLATVLPSLGRLFDGDA